MKIRDIPQIPRAYYSVHQSWSDLPEWLGRYQKEYNLNLDPDFQRGYVWTKKQKIAFVEWGLQGGESGMNIYTNHPHWMDFTNKGEFVLLDGKQRISAVQDFLGNKIKVFGHYYNEYEDKVYYGTPHFLFNVLTLKTRKDILEWYITFNSGGTVHSNKDIDKVKRMLEEEK